MPYTDAQMKATNKYIKNNYDRINVTVPAGQKEIWKAAADAAGISLNDFIRRCVNEKIDEGTEK